MLLTSQRIRKTKLTILNQLSDPRKLKLGRKRQFSHEKCLISMAALANERNWLQSTEKAKRSIRGGTCPGTQMFQESMRTHFTQVAVETEVRVTKKLSQECLRTKGRILGASSRLHEFLPSWRIRVHSGTASETFRNFYRENQECNQDSHVETILILRRVIRWTGPLILLILTLTWYFTE